MSDCAKCGACSTVCPVFRISGREGHTARGKLHLIETLGLAESSTVFVDIFSACLLCGACSEVCPRQIDIQKELVAARASFSSLAGPHAYEKYLARKLLDYPGSLTGLRVLGRACGRVFGNKLPQNSGLRLRLAMFQDSALSVIAEKRNPPKPSTGKHLTWFPGCSARHLFPDILDSCQSLLSDASFSLQYPEDLVCCGLADQAAGDIAGATKSACKNIEVMEATTGPILVSCASCYAHLKHYPELFTNDVRWQIRAKKIAARVVEMSAFLEIQKGQNSTTTPDRERKLKVFYHDPCHLRYDAENMDRARQQLQETGSVEVLELPDGPRCCGQGGLFHVAQPEISASIRDQLVQDVLALEPDAVTTTCSGCLMQWQQGLIAAKSDVKVLHLAQLLVQERTEQSGAFQK